MASLDHGALDKKHPLMYGATCAASRIFRCKVQWRPALPACCHVCFVMSDLVVVVIVVLAASRLNIALYSFHHMLIIALSCLISLHCLFNGISVGVCSVPPTLFAMDYSPSQHR